VSETGDREPSAQTLVGEILVAKKVTPKKHCDFLSGKDIRKLTPFY
jgi:hypothetical protein